MEKNSINRIEYSSYLQKYPKNDECSLEFGQNSLDCLKKIEEFYNESSSSFLINEDSINSIISPFYLFQKEDFKNKNEIISKDLIIRSSTQPILNIDENKNKNEKNSNDNLLRRIKTIVFKALLKFDNYIISNAYNNNIGNGITVKKLLKINYFPIKNINTDFNRNLLRTPQGNIFSFDISTRHSNFPLDHNKQLINRLLKEDNEEKRTIFNNLFKLTLSECIHHIIGDKKYKPLEGLEYFYEKEMIEYKENEKFKDELRKIIKLYEKIFNDKKPRKKKLRKKNIIINFKIKKA